MLGALLGSTACSLLFAAACHGAWSAPQSIASSSTWRYSRPQVAEDAAGDAVAVWYRFGPVRRGRQLGTVEAASRIAGGPWAAPVQLASGSMEAVTPTVAMSASGEATVAWEQSTPAAKTGTRRRSVRVAVHERSKRPGGSGWGRTVTLASRRQPAAGVSVPEPQAAVDAHGDVKVAFDLRERNAKPVNGWEDVLLVTRRKGRWSPPRVLAQTVTSGEARSETRLALDGRGETILAWGHSGAPGTNRMWVEALVLPSHSESKGYPRVLSSKSGAAYALGLAVNSNGAAALTWSEELPEGQGLGPVQAATRPPGGQFTNKPVTLQLKSSSAVLAIGGQGTATALFERAIPGRPGEEEARGPLQAATHPANGGWSKPRPISAEGLPEALASGPHEELLALWQADAGLPGPPSGQPAVINASIQPPGGTWQPPLRISPERIAEASTDLSLGASGRATAIWVREPTYATYLIETADYEP